MDSHWYDYDIGRYHKMDECMIINRKYENKKAFTNYKYRLFNCGCELCMNLSAHPVISCMNECERSKETTLKGLVDGVNNVVACTCGCEVCYSSNYF